MQYSAAIGKSSGEAVSAVVVCLIMVVWWFVWSWWGVGLFGDGSWVVKLVDGEINGW